MQLSGNFPRIRSYAEAEAYFNNTPARTSRMMKEGEQELSYGHKRVAKTRMWRENERPLNTNTYLGYTRVIRYDDGTYAMRYHDTDVISYHPNGSVTVVPFSTLSTDTFFRSLCPPLMYSQFYDGGARAGEFRPSDLLALAPPHAEHDGEYRRWQGPWHVYRLRGRTTFVPDEDTYRFEHEGDYEPWEWPVVDKARVRECLKPYRLRDLERFLTVTLTIDKAFMGSRVLAHDELRAILLDHTRWIELARNTRYMHKAEGKSHGWGSDPDNSAKGIARRACERFRIHLLRAHGIMQFETRPYLTSFGEVSVYTQLRRKYETGGL